MTAIPVVTRVSQATRAVGSLPMMASSTASEIWSAILSGWPSVTDSDVNTRSEEHTSELQSHSDLVCRLLLEKKKRHETALHGAAIFAERLQSRLAARAFPDSGE